MSHDVLTVTEISKILRVGRNTAYKLVKHAYEAGEDFPVRKIGGQYRIPRIAFFEWFNSKKDK